MLKVISDEADFIVAVKPAGLSFHSEQGAGFVALLEAQQTYKLYPVHRLDKVTSGLIVLAKSSQAAASLTELFSNRLVDKFYLAITEGKPKKKQGWIKGDMSASRRGTYKLEKTSNNPAVTRFYSTSLGEGLRGVILKPFSGKTHQLRVAMKSISSPILGDTAYTSSPSDRVYLHAFALSFQWQRQDKYFSYLPESGKEFNKLVTTDAFQHWKAPLNLDW
ncbi:pseudouridine synthase [Pseudoalteromonas phenolica]|uniref:pseudouridine synthase n=1 Tax=Pseudoalteromonas phenolica TaxID=161398 RepID=UPI0014867E88|nr:pseudouridine synthase [Pseudoalteromonas phenolica]